MQNIIIEYMHCMHIYCIYIIFVTLEKIFLFAYNARQSIFSLFFNIIDFFFLRIYKKFFYSYKNSKNSNCFFSNFC